MDDLIRLSLYQHTLTSVSTKWYIDELANTHRIFESIAKLFLTVFQLLVRQDVGIKILTSFCQTTSTDITDNIHEWRDVVCVKLKSMINS